MALLSTPQLLAKAQEAASVESTKTVPLPSLGDDSEVLIRLLSPAERDVYDEVRFRNLDEDGNFDPQQQMKTGGARCWLVWLATANPDGSRMFSAPAHVNVLANGRSPEWEEVIQTIYWEALEFNRMTMRTDQELGKKSETIEEPTSSSGLVSPPDSDTHSPTSLPENANTKARDLPPMTS